MCLAVPGKILRIIETEALMMAKVSFAGIIRDVCLAYVPKAKVNDYVLVHVGFAIAIISAQEAEKIFAYFEQNEN